MVRILLALLLLLLAACSHEGEVKATDVSSSSVSPISETVLKMGYPIATRKIAIILPMDSAFSPHFKRTVQWFNQNFAKTLGITALLADSVLNFEYEWYDESNVKLDSLSKELAKRNDILAIVGPLSSPNVNVAAGNAVRANKTIMVPIASSAEIVRKYSSRKNYWNLSETDITQSEMLLAQAAAYGYKRVSLLVGDTPYGKTFIDWFAFQAEELGLDVGNIFTYNGHSLKTNAQNAMSDSSECVIVVPAKSRDVKTILKYHKDSPTKPKLLFSNEAISLDVLLDGNAEGIEGMAMYADPESGFEISYRVAFGEYPLPGEAQLYDALLLIALGELNAMHRGKTLDEGIADVVREDSLSADVLAWTYEGMARVMQFMIQGRHVNIRGASGNLDFDTENGSVVTQSVYCHWMIYNGAFLALEYVSSKGNHRSSATLSSWNIAATKMQKFDTKGLFKYPKRRENYALLVAGSRGWVNYRHQADVLTVYQVLKYIGYDDDHIVLILADDLAENEKNPKKGTVENYRGSDVYQGVVIDYRLSDLTPNDIFDILDGQKSERLPQVVESDSTTNVLVFWSGHGREGDLVWDDKSPDSSFNYNMMSETMQKLSMQNKYRKMLWLVEACYSESVCEALEDKSIDHAMCITSADAKETSKADIYNVDYGTYMTNRFTEILIGLVKATKEKRLGKDDLMLNDLYFYLFKYTLGSHVACLNANRFDNLYQCGIREFIVPAVIK